MHENIPYVTVAYMKARHTLLRLLGNVPSAGWQVALCAPIWHVSSRSGEADYLRTAIPVYFTLLLLLAVRLIKPVSVFRNDNEFAHFCSNWHSLACHVTSKLWNDSSRIRRVLVYTAIFEKNMRNSTVNYLIPDWLTAVT